MQPFLNLFDEGWIVDQRGTQAHADKAIFLLTTNVGQNMIADMAAKGESTEAISVRIKEALSQIRHSKSNRPVFTAEFLARIKRVLVFMPLDQQAMRGIANRLVAQMQASWWQRREKRLTIAAEVMEHITVTAHQINTQSKGREGGRIVRKLLSDWIEGEIQRRISSDAQQYRKCDTVDVSLSQSAGDRNDKPEIRVDFVNDNQQTS
jgi:ATP-dependent Clp protease ATP-binding subunit ClpA